MPNTRVDLHAHSRYSSRSAEWLLRRFDFPDSSTEPAKLHEMLRQRGMDFVTITDHNTIDGCLEIAHLDGVFLSEELTTYFPDDQCKVHILVWGITEAQHSVLDRLRPDIFELQRYIAWEEIAHAVAHPLYNINQKLTTAHVEKLFLLFKHFEGINGLRDAMISRAFGTLVEALTPERIEQYASVHGIEPTHPEPWRKVLTGGSDDHGGIFPASAWTELPGQPRSIGEMLEQIRSGNCVPCGVAGTPLVLSHSLYNTAYKYVKSKFSRNVHGATDLAEKFVSRFLEGKNPTEFSLGEKLGFLTEGILSGRIFELANPTTSSLWRELAQYFNDPDLKAVLARETAGVAEPERRAFIMATHVSNELAFRFFSRSLSHISAGSFLESVQAISALVPIALSLSPYIYSLQSQCAPRQWLRSLMRESLNTTPDYLRNARRAWFTDTLEDVNGVTTTIRKMTAAAVAQGFDLTVVTSRTELGITGIPIQNFTPVGEFELPEYELQKLSFPPMLNILDYIQTQGFSEVIISTPGPIGLCGLIAAKMFGLRVSGIYHTDFPQYVRILSDDSFLETLTWNYMHWFYNALDTIYVNSEHYRRLWIERGIAPEKIAILPRGLDTELFHPNKRRASFWEQYGGKRGKTTLLYVGRISKEKDLDILSGAWSALAPDRNDMQLAFVGDGPYVTELKATHPEAIFTGYLSGETLATAYASADIFVFPSTTDTFGNVLLEAQAAGIPAVVSNLGGPSELVEDGKSGFISPALDVPAFTKAIRALVENSKLRAAMGAVARETVQSRSWASAAKQFWNMSGAE
jgi:glycosyltransferase involved in cell wall biosynthesis/predicted metal-dependent phosphoesterase TrpH